MHITKLWHFNLIKILTINLSYTAFELQVLIK